MIPTCVHLRLHKHPVKVDEIQEFKEKMCTLISEQVEKDTQGPNYAIFIKATKELLGNSYWLLKVHHLKNLSWKR